MFNVYKNQLSRQTGNRNLTGPKTLPTIWHTYMKLKTKYQISAEKNILDGRKVKQYTPPPLLRWSGDIITEFFGSKKTRGPKQDSQNWLRSSMHEREP